LSTQTVAVRTLDGVEFPVAGAYTLDASHTHAGFVVRHMKVAKVRGGFAGLTGSAVVAEDPLASSVEVSIDTASIATRDEQRDGHLRSPDFLDVDRHPTMQFRSNGLTATGAGRFEIAGELTIRGITREVVLDTTFEGALIDPWGNQRFGVTATTEINREDFGLTWNQALEAGGVLVGKKVRIEIEAELVRSQG